MTEILKTQPVLTSEQGEAIIKSYLAKIEEHSSLNAFVTVAAERAANRMGEICSARLHGPLVGFVLGVKDNIHVAGLRSTGGTTALQDFVPDRSSPIVKKLESAGAVVIGKTGMHELAYGITNNNAAFGPVRNPYDQEKIPGGSSGGSAAAVAAGLVTAALGTDTGGSVRLPAALTGTVGYRPTTGRYSGEETLQISDTRDTIGLITQTVADAILIDSQIVGRVEDSRPKDLRGLRIGVPRAHFYENLDPEVASVAEQFLDKLRGAGVVIVEANLADVPELNEKVGFPIVLYETRQLLPQYLKAHNVGVDIEQLVSAIASPDVSEVVGAAIRGAISQEEYLAAKDIFRPKLQQAYQNYFTQHDVEAVVFPTSPITARPIDGILDGVTVNGEWKETFPTYIQNSDPASNAGIPGISIPAGVTGQGLCVGMELDAGVGEDAKLLRIAKIIEELER